MLILFQADTTSVGYKVGYEIGTWLPVLILSALFIWMLLKALKRNKTNS